MNNELSFERLGRPRGFAIRQWGGSQDWISITWFVSRGATPAKPGGAPQLPAVAALAPVFTHNGLLGSAICPTTPPHNADPHG